MRYSSAAHFEPIGRRAFRGPKAKTLATMEAPKPIQQYLTGCYQKESVCLRVINTAKGSLRNSNGGTPELLPTLRNDREEFVLGRFQAVKQTCSSRCQAEPQVAACDSPCRSRSSLSQAPAFFAKLLLGVIPAAELEYSPVTSSVACPE